MATTEKSIDVSAPIRTVYDQWTRFEEFPRFMDDVESVEQLDGRHLHWKVRIAGVEGEFDAEIIDQVPEERIAWRSTGGISHAGVVTFHKIDDAATRVTFQLEMAPADTLEAVGESAGIVAMAAERDMKNFKEFVESRGGGTGARPAESRGDG